MVRENQPKPLFEQLESRILFSLLFGQWDAAPQPAPTVAAPAKPAKPGGTTGPAIRLDLVALHELGHSLGLAHSNDSSSIMYAYYNKDYNLDSFASDSAVTTFQSLYNKVDVASEATPWQDALDGSNDGKVQITYSFVLDGARMDQGGRSNTFATFDKKFGAGNWQGIFTGELNRWANVSNGLVSFAPFDNDGIEDAVYAFNTSGDVQNDSRFGDIRIAAHKFDGAGNVLAHAYYPPPNGVTAAGDAHFDSSENWVLAPAGSSAPLAAGETSETGSGNLALQSSASASPFASDKGVSDDALLDDADVTVL